MWCSSAGSFFLWDGTHVDCGLLCLRWLCRDRGLVFGAIPAGDSVEGFLQGVVLCWEQLPFESCCFFFVLVGSTLLRLWGERLSPRFVAGCVGNMDLGVYAGKDWVGMVPLLLPMLDVMKGSYL